jgi:hypothetical protein
VGRSEELSERKVAELYEQVGRVMVERDFLLRKSGLWNARAGWRWWSGRLNFRSAASASFCGSIVAQFYDEPVETGAYQLELMALIDRQYLRTPFYGSRRMTTWLQSQGHGVNRKRVQRLMQRMGLEVIYQRPRTSRPAPGATCAPTPDGRARCTVRARSKSEFCIKYAMKSVCLAPVRSGNRGKESQVPLPGIEEGATAPSWEETMRSLPGYVASNGFLFWQRLSGS